MLRKFVHATSGLSFRDYENPSDQYQSPMCLECDTSVNTVAKIASVELNVYLGKRLSVNTALQTRSERSFKGLSLQLKIK